jgi:chromosome segregation ATPase
MPISITCPKCSASGFVPDQALHQNATCPICQTTFIVEPSEAPPPPAALPDLGVWVEPMPVAPNLATAAPVTPVSVAAPPQKYAPPAVKPKPEDAAGMAGWFEAEKVRFQGYVDKELARLERVRKENALAESQHEASCINRSMDLSRLAANLDARQGDLARKEVELEKSKAAAAARQEQVEKLSAGFSEREEKLQELESRRNQLEEEAATLSALVAELRPAVQQLELRKTEAETIRAEMKAKQTTLDRRLIEVGRAELAMQKRMAELDEMEKTLQSELEQREADLERQRAMLLEEVRSLRTRMPAEPPPRVAADAPTPFPRSLSPANLAALMQRKIEKVEQIEAEAATT